MLFGNYLWVSVLMHRLADFYESHSSCGTNMYCANWCNILYYVKVKNLVEMQLSAAFPFFPTSIIFCKGRTWAKTLASYHWLQKKTSGLPEILTYFVYTGYNSDTEKHLCTQAWFSQSYSTPHGTAPFLWISRNILSGIRWDDLSWWKTFI